MPLEIRCRACKAETLLKREPVYDGFKKIGERLVCASCGHLYADEAEVPFQTRPEEPAVFNDSDRAETPQIFEADEAARLCRHCAHYTVNPFMQWCSEHKKEVAATDTCPQFEPPEETLRL